MDKGISFAGNLIVDFVKTVDVYPEITRLATIKGINKCVGGLVCNTGIAFSRLSRNKIPVKAYGRTGDDENGKYITDIMQKEGIDISGIKKTPEMTTSFTDVFTVESTGERTFFQNRGANSGFTPEDIDIEKMGSKILHIGYLLLLDEFDKLQKKDGTVMSIVRPGLKYVDYLILNETESGMVSGISPRDDNGRIDESNIGKICEYFMTAGVRELAAIHAPEGSYCMEDDGRLLFVPAANLPKGSIKGKVGAGDSFTAGMLYALYEGADGKDAMRLGNGAAALSLLGGSVMNGLSSAEAAYEVYKKYNG